MENVKTDELVRLDMGDIMRRSLPVLRRFWFIFLALIVLGATAASLRAKYYYTPMYKSEAVFSVSVSANGSYGLTDYSSFYDNAAAKQAAETFSYLLSSDLMRELISQELGGAYINGNIKASSVAETNFFVLTVTSNNSADAYRIIQAVMNVYPRVSRQVIGETQLAVTREPVQASTPYNTFSWKHSALKGGICGLLLSMAILFATAISHRTAANSEDVKKILNLDCLSHIPYVKIKQRSSGKNSGALITTQAPDSAFCESFRLLRLKLLRKLNSNNEKVFLFTSSIPSEGKTSLAVNTALSLARDGKKVLLIDADLRNPSVKPLLDMEKPSIGLGECLSQSTDEVHFLRYKDTTLFVFAGDRVFSNPTSLLRRDQLHDMISSMREMFDYIIIDTPPCTTTADAATLCAAVDKVIYVIRENYALRTQIYDGVQSISNNGGQICGFVLNYCTGFSHSSRYGYGYSKYGYGKYGYGKYGYGKYGYSKYGYSKKKDNS